jgi:hypothetical protein
VRRRSSRRRAAHPVCLTGCFSSAACPRVSFSRARDRRRHTRGQHRGPAPAMARALRSHRRRRRDRHRLAALRRRRPAVSAACVRAPAAARGAPPRLPRLLRPTFAQVAVSTTPQSPRATTWSLRAVPSRLESPWVFPNTIARARKTASISWPRLHAGAARRHDRRLPLERPGPHVRLAPAHDGCRHRGIFATSSVSAQRA